jgi:hypothetical protein
MKPRSPKRKDPKPKEVKRDMVRWDHPIVFNITIKYEPTSMQELRQSLIDEIRKYIK